MNQPSKTPAQSFAELRGRLQDPEFLAGHGLGNEVPFFILPYAAAQEDEVRAQTASLLEDFPAEQDVNVNLSFADSTNVTAPIAPTHPRRFRRRQAPFPASRSGARSFVR